MLNMFTIDDSAGTSSSNPSTKVKKGSKRKAAQPADTSEEGRAEGERADSPFDGVVPAASGEVSTPLSKEEASPVRGSSARRLSSKKRSCA